MEESVPLRESRIPTLVVAGLVFLLPVFMLPFGGFQTLALKVALAGLAVFVLGALLVLGILKRGSVSFVRSLFAFAVILLPILYAVSAIFSAHQALSFFGYQIESDTVAFMALGSVLALLVTASIPRTGVFSVLLGLLGAAWIVFLFQLIQVLFNAPFGGFFGTPITNLVGSWGDFTVFAGLIVILLLVVMESLSLPRLHRIIVGVTLAIALFFVMLGNFKEVWVVIGLVAFALLVYTLASRFFFVGDGKKPGTGAVPIAVLILSLFFIFGGSAVSTAVQQSLNASALSVRPSVGATLGVLKGVYAHNPIVGSGPNTFVATWLLYRPAGVLVSPFWNVYFMTGFGAVPSAIATGGIVIAFGWLFLLGMVGWMAGRALFSVPAGADRMFFITAISALGMVYLGVMEVITVPGPTLGLLFFVMLGLFMASIKGTALLRIHTLSFSAAPRIGFAAVLLMLVLAGAGVIGLYGIGRVITSTILYNRAVVAANAGNFDAADSAIAAAITSVPMDLYYRAATSIGLARISSIFSSGKTDAATQTAFRNALTKAVQDSGSAVQADPQRYENWLSRADVYATAVPLQIQGAADNTKNALDTAARLSPKSPEVDYRRAQTAVALNDTKGAREAIASALEKKADYTDAILFLAQIELNDGNMQKAIDSVKAAVYFEPQNPLLLYQLGVLLLANRAYADAANTFQAALTAEPQFQNAQFFLAQADAFLKNYSDAATLMKDLADKNPDNAIVAAYARDLAAGKNPFTASTPPPEETKTSVLP